MKRWLKKHGKWLMVGLGVLFITNSSNAIFSTSEEWKLLLHIGAITLWVILILLYSGALGKIYKWWEKG